MGVNSNSSLVSQIGVRIPYIPTLSSLFSEDALRQRNISNTYTSRSIIMTTFTLLLILIYDLVYDKILNSITGYEPNYAK